MLNGPCRHVVVALLIAAGVRAADEHPVVVYPCPRIQQPPHLDGKPDEESWKQAPLVSGFTFYNKPESPAAQTAFRAAYDDHSLYLAIVCSEPTIDKLPHVKLPRDDKGVFGQEAIELFVDPGHDHKSYHQFGISVTGAVYDARLHQAAWNSGIRAAPDIGDDAWSLEIALPWADYEIEPRPGTIIGLNICRNRYIGPVREWTNWSQTNANFHDPERFGHLVLSPTPQQLAELAPEFRKGERSGPLRIFSAEGFADETYSAMAMAGLARAADALDDLRKMERAETDPRTAQELGRRIGELRRQWQQMKEQVVAGRLDAAEWVQMDRKTHALIGTARQTVWEARLAALLAGI